MTVPSLLALGLEATLVMPGAQVALDGLSREALAEVPRALRLDHADPHVLHVPDIRDGRVVSRPFADFRNEPDRFQWVLSSIARGVGTFGTPIGLSSVHRLRVGSYGPANLLTAEYRSSLLRLELNPTELPVVTTKDGSIGMKVDQLGTTVYFTGPFTNEGVPTLFSVELDPRHRGVLTTRMQTTTHGLYLDHKLSNSGVDAERQLAELMHMLGGAFVSRLIGSITSTEDRDHLGQFTASAEAHVLGWHLKIGKEDLDRKPGERLFKMTALYTGEGVASLAQLFAPQDAGQDLFYGNFIVP